MFLSLLKCACSLGEEFGILYIVIEIGDLDA